MGTEDGMSNPGNTESAEGIQCLTSKVNGNGVANTDGDCVAEEARHLKIDGMYNGNGGVSEEAGVVKSEALDNGVASAYGNGVAEKAGALKTKTLNNGVVSGHGNGVAEEAGLLKSEAISSVLAFADGFDSSSRGCGRHESLQTYKRRKCVIKSSLKRKAQEDCRECDETASQIANQIVKEPFDATLGNAVDDCAHKHWGNVVLKHLCQSLGNANGNSGGIEGCIREALIHHPQENVKIDKDGHDFSSQFDCLSHKTRNGANGQAHVMQNGSSSDPHGRGATEMCQRMLRNILTSEKFSSLCKVLLENFQGMKPESVFDFSVMNSRMKQQTYEQSPTLFLSDIQQVWRKLQDTCNEIVSLTKSLSNMSRTSYCDLFYQQSDSHMKPEQTEECATYKTCSCSHCGEKADGTDCLVCDSCEGMYHLSCIEPALREIPRKSWYCANCTASGIGSPHENCVVCERLNDAKTPNNVIGDGILPSNVETRYEIEENSNCTYDGIQVSIGGEEPLNCKICRNELDGDKVKICGHPYCPSKCYHVRCLPSKLLKSYAHCWYCPSCICQVCLTDRDDDQIVLCDACDHAHHIYCMQPPQTSIPEGKWFCVKCDAGIKAIYQAKKAYETNKPRTGGKNVSNPNANNEKKCNNRHVQELERGGGMDMLLTAANSLIQTE